MTFVGIVENQGEVSASWIKVTVNLKDKGGKVVASDFGWVEARELLPGEKWPFEVSFFGN